MIGRAQAVRLRAWRAGRRPALQRVGNRRAGAPALDSGAGGGTRKRGLCATDRIRPLGVGRWELKAVIDDDCRQGLEQLKGLESHVDPRLTLGQLPWGAWCGKRSSATTRSGRRAAGAPASGPMRGAARNFGAEGSRKVRRHVGATERRFLTEGRGLRTHPRYGSKATRRNDPSFGAEGCHRAGWRCGCAGRRRTFASEGVGGLAGAGAPYRRSGLKPLSGSSLRRRRRNAPGKPRPRRRNPWYAAAPSRPQSSGRCGSARPGLQLRGPRAAGATAALAEPDNLLAAVRRPSPPRRPCTVAGWAPPAVERPAGTQAS